MTPAHAPTVDESTSSPTVLQLQAFTRQLQLDGYGLGDEATVDDIASAAATAGITVDPNDDHLMGALADAVASVTDPAAPRAALAGDALVEASRTIATGAHAGQRDQAGRPYISHPARVAHRLNDDLSKATAWLHDVLEDTDVTTGDLRSAGVPEQVIGAVEALTHHRNESRDAYYARVRAAGDLAVRVKLADIDDNTDPERLALLDEATRERLTAKYAKARAAITRPSEQADA